MCKNPTILPFQKKKRQATYLCNCMYSRGRSKRYRKRSTSLFLPTPYTFAREDHTCPHRDTRHVIHRNTKTRLVIRCTVPVSKTFPSKVFRYTKLSTQALRHTGTVRPLQSHNDHLNVTISRMILL